MKLRVWWIPQMPMTRFEVPVRTLVEARLILDTLARYDVFQLENRIKPDYANAGGLVMAEEGEWVDWEPDEIIRNRATVLFPDDYLENIDSLTLAQFRKLEGTKP